MNYDFRTTRLKAGILTLGLFSIGLVGGVPSADAATALTVLFTSPSNGAKISGKYPIAGKASASLTSMSFSIDGRTDNPVVMKVSGTTGSVTLYSSNLNNGKHTFILNATSTSGAKASST